jgi:23S rRNA pseudouridine1911/1915/1917 synthase
MMQQRLDKALSFLESVGTRSRAESLIKEGLVHINGKVSRSSYRVQMADILEIYFPPKASSQLVAYNFNLDIHFEDESLIVINKPPGLVVHPAAGHADDTLVNALINYSSDFLMKFKDSRPGIVHRLDKDTSGLLVIAKNDQVLEGLAQQFKERSVHRIYQAIVLSPGPNPSGRVCSYLARHPRDRKKYSSVLDKNKRVIRSTESPPAVGKWSATNYKTLKRLKDDLALLELRLETGRTHQIRVHLSEMGSPILFDDLYGNKSKETKLLKKKSLEIFPDSEKRCALHAMELGFIHPVSKQAMTFKVDWPDLEEIHRLFEGS